MFLASHLLPSAPRHPSYDFVVCGGGAAGCALAARLSEDDSVRVLLLEAGGHGLVLDARVPAAAGKLQRSGLDWADACEPQPGRAFTGLFHPTSGKGAAFWPRGKVLGGGTVINYMAYVRGSKHDYDAWAAAAHDERWSYANVLPVLRRLENASRVADHVDRDVRGFEGPVVVSRREPVNPIAARFVEACRGLGYHVGDYNGHDAERVDIHQTTTRDGARWSAADAYIWPNVTRPNLDVVIHAHVVRVLLEQDPAHDEPRAVGVEFLLHGRTRTVECKREVVLSASPVGSPSILLRSGIGPRAKLDKIGVSCRVDLPGVGECLQDHVLLAVLVRPGPGTAQVDIGAVNKGNAERLPNALPALFNYFVRGKGPLASSAYDASVFLRTGVNPEPWPDAQVSVFASTAGEQVWRDNLCVPATGYLPPDVVADDGQGLLLVPILLHPHSRGSVELRSADPGSKPVINANYFSDERDVATFVAALERTHAIAIAMRYGDVVVPQDLDGAFKAGRREEVWREMIKRYATTVYHPAATCAMGTVVDGSLRVKGVRGLRVADSSVMPTLTSGNTQVPSMLVGEVASDVMAEAHGLKRTMQGTARESIAAREFRRAVWWAGAVGAGVIGAGLAAVALSGKL